MVLNQKNNLIQDKIYDFGLIIEDFNNDNLENIIDFLKNKKSVILIGNNCDRYSYNNFKLINSFNYQNIIKYTNYIKYIVKNNIDDINIYDINSYINGSIILKMLWN